MPKIACGIGILVLIAGVACHAPDKPAAKPAAKAEAAAPPIDAAAALEAITNGDQADVVDALQSLSRERAGWAAGKYDSLYAPLWALFVKSSAAEAGPANSELRSGLHNIFNFGNWYPLLGEFLTALKTPALPPAVRQAAAEHIWRFAGEDKENKGFSIPASDRPRIQAAVVDLLQEKKDLVILSTAVTTAALLDMKSAAARLKAIVAEQPFGNTETRGFRFTLGEALFALGEVGPAVDVMRKLVDDKGDFSEEAADFLKDKHLY
jgi:hypothetical protein